MKRVLRDERGMALAVAIFALVVVGALVAGAFFAGNQEQRVGENTRRLEKSFGVAEYGIANQMLTWQPDSFNLRPNYPSDSVAISATTAAAGGGTYGGWVLKLNNDLFMLDIVGTDSMSRAGRAFGGGARQRIGLITRLKPLEVDVQASLTTQGSVSLQGNAQVNGSDATPTGWTNCDAPGASQAGIRTDGGSVTTGGNAIVTGNPPVKNDPSVSDSTFTQFGDLGWSDLVAMATINLPSGTYQTQPSFTGTGACDKTDLQNWGDGMNPSSACGSYFPIIYINGDATLNGVQGQGILLVNGTLSVQGSYEFYGIAIMQGDLKTSGGGSTEAHFWGGTMSKNADLSVQNLSGKATINYSSCALTRALQATAMPAMMRSRGWTQLF
jgi:hypothetical protein